MREIEFCGHSVNKECFCEMLTMQLMPVRGNEKKLTQMPHRSMEDLALAYRLDLGRIGLHDLSAVISYELLKMLDITEAQLAEEAEQNAPRTHPAVIQTLYESMMKISGGILPDLPAAAPGLYVASTSSGCLGAGVIGYPGFLADAAVRLDGSFFVIPSSIHELLLLKDDGSIDAESLGEMVRSVNRSCVSPEERLSDHVYYYDAKTHRFCSRGVPPHL